MTEYEARMNELHKIIQHQSEAIQSLVKLNGKLMGRWLDALPTRKEIMALVTEDNALVAGVNDLMSLIQETSDDSSEALQVIQLQITQLQQSQNSAPTSDPAVVNAVSELASAVATLKANHDKVQAAVVPILNASNASSSNVSTGTAANTSDGTTTNVSSSDPNSSSGATTGSTATTINGNPNA